MNLSALREIICAEQCTILYTRVKVLAHKTVFGSTSMLQSRVALYKEEEERECHTLSVLLHEYKLGTLESTKVSVDNVMWCCVT